MNKTISTKIIILKKTAYQESSLIVSTISAEYGKIDFVVKGARRITKNKQPIVDLFRELAVEFRESSSGLNSPVSLDLLKEHDKLALNPDIYLDVSRLASFLLRNIYPNVPCPRAYSALSNLLNKAAVGSIIAFDFILLKLVFLFENGLLPENFETNTDSQLQHTAEVEKQRKFLNMLILYAEGKLPDIPTLSTDYKNKFSAWVNGLCHYNDLE